MRGLCGMVMGVVLASGVVGWGQRAKPSAAVPAAGARVAAKGLTVAGGRRGDAGEGSVERFLREFERASEANDADRKAALYGVEGQGEEVDRYFLRTHVTRAFVYRDVLDWLSGGRLITRFHLTVLREEGKGEGVGAERTLLVRKEASWMAAGERREMEVRSQLVLRRGSEGWRIVGERDYKAG